MECAALAKFGYKPLIYGLLVSRVHVCIVDRPRPLCLNFGSTACCVTEKKKKFLKQNSSSEFSLLLRRCTFMKQKDVVGTNSVTQKQFPETKGIWKHRRDRCYWLCSQNDPCEACWKMVHLHVKAVRPHPCDLRIWTHSWATTFECKASFSDCLASRCHCKNVPASKERSPVQSICVTVRAQLHGACNVPINCWR